MIIVNYKSKRQLKKHIGLPLTWIDADTVVQNNRPFFVTNQDSTFKAIVVLIDGKIESVR